jgi:CubicO group peptidase (beta-lactamase class C family)
MINKPGTAATAGVVSTGVSTATALDLAAARGGMARLLVQCGDETLLDESLGCARDTLFLLFSAGKPLTALAVHHLAERGLIDLDAPVCAYWPEYADGGKRGVTVRHVLRHRSGAPVSTGSILGDARIMTDWDRSVWAAERARPRWPAGEVTAYHILSYGFVLGELVRRVSGLEVSSYARQALLEPLGLRETHFGLPHGEERRSAPLRPYSGGPASRLRSAYFNRPAVREAVVPAATVTATAADVARLYRMLLLGGTIDGIRVLREQTVAAALRPTSADGEKDRVLRIPIRWAEGFQLGGAVGRAATAMGTAPGRETFGHNGSYVCSAWADPRRDLVCVYLTNLVVGRADGERHHAAVSDAVLREFG